MTNHFEYNSASNNSNHILNNLEFTPEPPTIEEQELALLDLQKRFMSEWADDPNGFMIWLIRRADSYSTAPMDSFVFHLAYDILRAR